MSIVQEAVVQKEKIWTNALALVLLERRLTRRRTTAQQYYLVRQWSSESVSKHITNPLSILAIESSFFSYSYSS